MGLKNINSDGSTHSPKPKVVYPDGSVDHVPVKVIYPDGTVTTIYEPKTLVNDWEQADLSYADRHTNSAFKLRGGPRGQSQGLYGKWSPQGEIMFLAESDAAGSMPRGYKYEFWWTHGSGSQRGIFFFGKSNTYAYDHYELWIFPSRLALVYETSSSGNTVLVEDTSFTSPAEAQRVVLDYGGSASDTIGVEVYTNGTLESSISVTDTRFNGAGYGGFTYKEEWFEVGDIYQL